MEEPRPLPVACSDYSFALREGIRGTLRRRTGVGLGAFLAAATRGHGVGEWRPLSVQNESVVSSLVVECRRYVRRWCSLTVLGTLVALRGVGAWCFRCASRSILPGRGVAHPRG